MVKSLLAVVLALATSSVCAGEPGRGMYLFDFLDKPAYRQSWNALFRGEKNVDPWLARYARTTNGPTAPEPSVQLGGVRYEMANVCKAHDCGDNRFFVLFAPNGRKAWGLLLKDMTNERFFGRPDDEKKDALREAARR